MARKRGNTMTPERKSELTAQLIAIIAELTSSDTDIDFSVLTTENKTTDNVEMLTIKECTGLIKGLSENTLRQLCAQKKIKYIRTGQGKRGKILINKTDLIRYFS